MPHPAHALTRWDADAIAGWGRLAPDPQDDPAAREALIGPELAPAPGCAEAILSWGAETPPGSWVELQLRARHGGAWRPWRRVAAWDSAAPAASRRASFDEQRDAEGHLATDTLVFARPPEALQPRALLCGAGEAGALPRLTALALSTSGARRWQPGDPTPAAVDHPPARVVPPLLLSQYDYPAGAGWCSPTCLTMALAYWHVTTGDQRLAPFAYGAALPGLVAPMVYDPAYEGTGNWPFNTAYAAACGMVAYVTRLERLEQLARWVAARVPVVISLAWQEGDLDGAPIPRSAGHLTLVIGVDGEWVLAAEPAVRDGGPGLRRYRADQLFACWQRASAGAVYLIHPPGWRRPAPGPGDAWA